MWKNCITNFPTRNLTQNETVIITILEPILSYLNLELSHHVRRVTGQVYLGGICHCPTRSGRLSGGRGGLVEDERGRKNDSGGVGRSPDILGP